MLTNSMLDQMQALGLSGMVSAYRELADQAGSEGLSRDEWLGLMLDREVATRSDKRLANRLAAARLRLIHNAHRIALEGDSMRKTCAPSLLTHGGKAEIITA